MNDSRSSSFTPFGGSDFLMEEVDKFLEHDDSIPPGVEGVYDSEERYCLSFREMSTIAFGRILGLLSVPNDSLDQEKTTIPCLTGHWPMSACLLGYAKHRAHSKDEVYQAPILVAPDWDLPFEIMCDASDLLLGAVLGHIRCPRAIHKLIAEPILQCQFAGLAKYGVIMSLHRVSSTNQWTKKFSSNELNELRDHAYENSLTYKEKTKRIHDSKIKNGIARIVKTLSALSFIFSFTSVRILSSFWDPDIRRLFYGRFSFYDPNADKIKEVKQDTDIQEIGRKKAAKPRHEWKDKVKGQPH
ncbi:hypothetical protein Tco_0820629 [Tanacetum coccineum]|uniref:Reverse transcriptase/retrotransposon-derived protein RNase H-like domain-containing protein n=1 Tax=Tanacetum coccineum TaxID=301880 RepID=A0ABQ5A9Z4_9ASTR